MIEFEEVTKSYLGMRPVLESVGVRIDQGEFFYLTGVSGAGKTTVFRMMLRMEHPESGRIRIDGEDITRLNHRRTALLRRRVGMVFQDYRLLPDLTIEQNVALPLQVSGWKRPTVRSRVAEILSWVGLRERRGEIVKALSGGEQQLVALSRAMVFDPPIVLADEPTGNLDQNMAYTVMSLLTNLNKRGTTVIVATHDLNLIRAFRARTLLIKDRRVHEVRAEF